MGRIVNAVLLAVMMVAAGVTYGLKHRAEVEADNIASLQSAIGSEKQSITMLRAEWSKLTQPSWLQALVTRYNDQFKLQAFSAAQVAILDEVPAKPADPKDMIAKKIAAAGD